MVTFNPLNTSDYRLALVYILGHVFVDGLYKIQAQVGLY